MSKFFDGHSKRPKTGMIYNFCIMIFFNCLTFGIADNTVTEHVNLLEVAHSELYQSIVPALNPGGSIDIVQKLKDHYKGKPIVLYDLPHIPVQVFFMDFGSLIVQNITIQSDFRMTNITKLVDVKDKTTIHTTIGIENLNMIAYVTSQYDEKRYFTWMYELHANSMTVNITTNLDMEVIPTDKLDYKKVMANPSCLGTYFDLSIKDMAIDADIPKHKFTFLEVHGSGGMFDTYKDSIASTIDGYLPRKGQTMHASDMVDKINSKISEVFDPSAPRCSVFLPHLEPAPQLKGTFLNFNNTSARDQERALANLFKSAVPVLTSVVPHLQEVHVGKKFELGKLLGKYVSILGKLLDGYVLHIDDVKIDGKPKNQGILLDSMELVPESNQTLHMSSGLFVRPTVFVKLEAPGSIIDIALYVESNLKIATDVFAALRTEFADIDFTDPVVAKNPTCLLQFVSAVAVRSFDLIPGLHNFEFFVTSTGSADKMTFDPSMIQQVLFTMMNRPWITEHLNGGIRAFLRSMAATLASPKIKALLEAPHPSCKSMKMDRMLSNAHHTSTSIDATGINASVTLRDSASDSTKDTPRASTRVATRAFTRTTTRFTTTEKRPVDMYIDLKETDEMRLFGWLAKDIVGPGKQFDLSPVCKKLLPMTIPVNKKKVIKGVSVNLEKAIMRDMAGIAAPWNPFQASGSTSFDTQIAANNISLGLTGSMDGLSHFNFELSAVFNTLQLSTNATALVKKSVMEVDLGRVLVEKPTALIPHVSALLVNFQSVGVKAGDVTLRVTDTHGGLTQSISFTELLQAFHLFVGRQAAFAGTRAAQEMIPKMLREHRDDKLSAERNIFTHPRAAEACGWLSVGLCLTALCLLITVVVRKRDRMTSAGVMSVLAVSRMSLVAFHLLLASATCLLLASVFSMLACIRISVSATGDLKYTGMLAPVFKFSAISILLDMISSRTYLLMFFLGLFGGVWTGVKLVILTFALLVKPTASDRVLKIKASLLSLQENHGKWSYVVAFFMVILIAAFRMSIILKSENETAVVDFFVDVESGFYALILANIYASLLSHCVCAMHRAQTCVKEIETDTARVALRTVMHKIEEKWWSKPVVHSKIIPVAVALSVPLIFVGSFVKTFSIRYTGVMSYLIPQDQVHMSYSMVGMLKSVTNPLAAHPGMIYLFAVLLVLLMFVFVFMFLGSTFFAWAVPMRHKHHGATATVMRAVKAWAAFDVLIVTVILTVVQTAELGTYVVGTKCTNFEKMLNIESCYKAEADFHIGAWLALVIGFVAHLAGGMMMMLCQKTLTVHSSSTDCEASGKASSSSGSES